MEAKISRPAEVIYYTAATAVILFLLLSKKSKRRVRLPPSGPLALPFIGHLYLIKPPVHQALFRISSRYGPILLLRFGSRRILVVSSADIAEECFTTNDLVFANRPPLLSVKHFGCNYADLGSAPYGPHWLKLRRFAAHEIFSPSRISVLSSLRASVLHSLIRRLYHNSLNQSSPATFNMKAAMAELTFNTATQMIAGKSCYDRDGQQLEKIIREVFWLLSGSSSMLEDFLPFVKLFGMNDYKNRVARLMAEIDEAFQSIINERRGLIEDLGEVGAVKERMTIVDVMLELQKREPQEYTDDMIKGMILDLVTAGTETCAGTLEWAMTLLLNNPQAQQKAREEIETHVGDDCRLLTDSDLPKLRYLHNTVKETLRLFPAAPLLLPHFSSDDCTVAGFDIPRGTMSLINAYAIHRDENVWKDANKFRPERFGNDQSEPVAEGSCRNIPFGAGRRRCPGENLATRMMVLALGTLVQCFEWERMGDEEVDMVEGEGITLPKANALVAKYRPRPSMVNVLSQL